MKILFKLFVFIFLISSCKEEKAKTNDRWDTVIFHRGRKNNVWLYERQLIRHEIKDSVIYLDYRYRFKKDTFNQHYQFPTKGKLKHQFENNGGHNVTLLDSLRFEKGTIYKYDLDIDGADNNAIAYYNRKYGLLRLENIVWHNHEILHNNIDDEFLKIYQVQEKIREKLKPFRSLFHIENEKRNLRK